MKKLLTLLLSAITLNSHAITYTQQIENIRLKMNSPKNEIQKWITDMWSFSTYSCANHEKIKISSDFKIYGNGTFILPSNINNYCKSLADNGPTKLECFNLKPSQHPFKSSFNNLSADYLYLDDTKSLIANSVHTIGGYCNLVKDDINTRQFYSGPASIRWITLPKKTKINTAKGYVDINLGTVEVDVNNGQFKSYLNVVTKK